MECFQQIGKVGKISVKGQRVNDFGRSPTISVVLLCSCNMRASIDNIETGMAVYHRTLLAKIDGGLDLTQSLEFSYLWSEVLIFKL